MHRERSGLKMKLSAKPLSSPGRTEKFPPPLMRFLRTNVGSKSRGRSRSSPMFVRKRNNINNNSAIETTQEPSSPKVTCMGQVRVKRSSKKGPKKKPPKPPSSCRCQCIPGKYLFFCRHFPGKILSRPKLRRAVWSKWASFFQLSFRRKVGIRGEDSSKNVGSRFEEKSKDSEDSEQEQEDEKETKNKIFLSSISPPKNALILTRCRSAPYRSSSLACRFWGSPLKSEEELKKEIENKKDEDEEEEEKEKPKLEMERLSCEESKMEDSEEIEEKSKLSVKEFEGSETGKRSSESSKTEEEEEKGKFVERPLVLTRCKSEPARTGEKLDPVMGFWTDRKLGILNSCSASIL